MSNQEKKDFPFDMKLIDWKILLNGFCYGIQWFFLREDHLSPDTGFKQLLSKN